MLFATDLDGTLVDRQDGIHPRDLEAIATARARGVVVTIATGRLTSKTHPVARALGLDTPLVCADGGVLACSTTERVLRRRFVPTDLAAQILESFRRAELASFVMTPAVIHGCDRGVSHHPYLQGWARSITTHNDLLSAAAWRSEEQGAIMLVGIGDEHAAKAVVTSLASHDALIDTVSFPGASGRVVRVMVKGASKGAALAELASELEIEPAHVAVAGDWLNDLSMFQFAGRSFAMPHAPPEVRAAATHALEHDITRHGAFADALEQWLQEHS